MKENRLKIATDVPDPRPLTAEDWAQIERDVEAWRKAIKKITEKMEHITGDDLRIIVR